MKIKVVIDRTYGHIELEGDSVDEIVEKLKGIPEFLTIIDEVILKPGFASSPQKEKEEELAGIIEYTYDGPQVILPLDKLTDREAIGLILYSSDPTTLKPKDLSRLLNLSGKLSRGFAARLSEMKREGYIVREGDAYRLSASGKQWVEKLIKRLKG
jgi:hypothetical protein